MCLLDTSNLKTLLDETNLMTLVEDHPHDPKAVSVGTVWRRVATMFKQVETYRRFDAHKILVL